MSIRLMITDEVATLASLGSTETCTSRPALVSASQTLLMDRYRYDQLLPIPWLDGLHGTGRPQPDPLLHCPGYLVGLFQLTHQHVVNIVFVLSKQSFATVLA